MKPMVSDVAAMARASPFGGWSPCLRISLETLTLWREWEGEAPSEPLSAGLGRSLALPALSLC